MIGNSDTESREIGASYLASCRRLLLEEYEPRIVRCLAELTEADVWWRAHESDNSVGNLLLHLSGNVRQWIVGGLGGEESERNRPAEFAERREIAKDELLRLLAAALTDAGRVIEAFDPQRLLERTTIQNYDVTYLDALSHVVEHFAQHLGQIVYITKLRTGRDLKFYDL